MNILSNKQSYFGFLSKLSLLAFSVAAIAPLAPAQASDPAVVKEAELLCIDKAKGQGFELTEVFYSGAAEIPGKDAKIVLKLTKGGTAAQLTCYYEKATGTVNFADDASAPARTPAPPVPWWGFIFPLLGLLALWFLGKDKDEAVTYGHRYEATIRSGSADPVPVYEEPSFASKVIGHVYNGDTVSITDRDIAIASDDWIQLATGGWVAKQYAGTPTR